MPNEYVRVCCFLTWDVQTSIEDVTVPPRRRIRPSLFVIITRSDLQFAHMFLVVTLPYHWAGQGFPWPVQSPTRARTETETVPSQASEVTYQNRLITCNYLKSNPLLITYLGTDAINHTGYLSARLFCGHQMLKLCGTVYKQKNHWQHYSHSLSSQKLLPNAWLGLQLCIIRSVVFSTGCFCFYKSLFSCRQQQVDIAGGEMFLHCLKQHFRSLNWITLVSQMWNTAHYVYCSFFHEKQTNPFWFILTHIQMYLPLGTWTVAGPHRGEPASCQITL